MPPAVLKVAALNFSRGRWLHRLLRVEEVEAVVATLRKVNPRNRSRRCEF